MAVTESVAQPHWGWFALLDGGLVFLCAASFSLRAYQRLGRVAPVRLPRQSSLRGLFGGAVAVHVLEAVAAARGARRRALPVRGWALQTLVVGFPSLRALHR